MRFHPRHPRRVQRNTDRSLRGLARSAMDPEEQADLMRRRWRSVGGVFRFGPPLDEAAEEVWLVEARHSVAGWVLAGLRPVSLASPWDLPSLGAPWELHHAAVMIAPNTPQPRLYLLDELVLNALLDPWSTPGGFGPTPPRLLEAAPPFEGAIRFRVALPQGTLAEATAPPPPPPSERPPPEVMDWDHRRYVGDSEVGVYYTAWLENRQGHPNYGTWWALIDIDSGGGASLTEPGYETVRAALMAGYDAAYEWAYNNEAAGLEPGWEEPEEWTRALMDNDEAVLLASVPE